MRKRSSKYFDSLIWFSALWAIKEFILEPIIHKAKDGQKKLKQKPAKYTADKKCR